MHLRLRRIISSGSFYLIKVENYMRKLAAAFAGVVFGLSIPSFVYSQAAVGRADAGDLSKPVRYRIDPAASKFMVLARRGGLGWFKGKSHYLAVRDFEGVASLDLAALDPASLQLTARAASIEETGADFTQQQKAIIKKELEDIVLETNKYPDITFKSTSVKGHMRNGAFYIKLIGDMTLHGVTRRIEIPAAVTVRGDTLEAKGEFSLDRKKFRVNATEAFHGFVRVKHTLQFTFDIIARRM